ncbi:lactoylglutathione lyase [Mycolicibacterium cyprinidarum]|uniref:Lactoylglutathione lyase n=1 Tax=Mycolicibacterium cyprinidarum TaxID=2860311 RepID=A0ABQ4V674_9MYCO|nr:lactoylglutathione lyase [Mycolicibacterium sp. NGTWSNA01]GJF15073.1 lactoylglutathione lyase [Mycolicibacterium sp. NGTWS0302]
MGVAADILDVMLDQTPVQIAWVTRDLAATETVLTSLLGARKWVRMPGVHFSPDTCRYRGHPADFVADISLSYAGDTQLELIAPVSGRSIYTEFLDQCGPGLHHICVETEDPERFDSAVNDAERSGAPVVMAGTMPGGMRFAYVSAEHSGVPYIEIAYIPDEIRAFFEQIKRQTV